MSFEFGPGLAASEQHDITTLRHQFAVNRYLEYRALPDVTAASAGMLLWNEELIGFKERASYQLAAASCCSEAALYPAPVFDEEARHELLERASNYWYRAYDRELTKKNDIAERAKWALCQMPTYKAVASYIVTGQIPDRFHDEQEELFREHFDHLLDRWEEEDLGGHALEVLISYFSHRSNRLRPNELPLYATPACLRDDYHTDENDRVDVDVYDLEAGLKYGIQVKAGRVVPPRGAKHRRIFFPEARKLLCLPSTDRAVSRTLEAIVTDDPDFRNDLDTIAADNRARIKYHFVSPHYEGRLIKRAL